MSKYIDMTGMIFGALRADKFLGGNYGEWECTCLLCNEKYVTRGKHLRNGDKIMCNECKKAGKTIEEYKKPVIDVPKIKYDMTGKRIGSITVNEYYKDGSWKCTCDCGNKIIVKGYNLRDALENNRDYCCEECANKKRLDDLTGKQFGNWLVLSYEGNQMYKCQCQCENKTVKLVDAKSLKTGASKSCGCLSRNIAVNTRYSKYGDIASGVKIHRTDEQIIASESCEQLKAFIIRNFVNKPTITELADKLGISTCMTARKIHKFGIENYIDYSNKRSEMEKSIERYIKTLYDGEIIHNDKTVLHGQELDIYIPDKHIAIEFDGNYWHSTLFKDKKYHQQKTLNCAKAGVRLIHIFEYEWKDAEKQRKIKELLNGAIGNSNTEVLYARKLRVDTVDINTEKEFLNKYHLQGYAHSTIKIGLYNEDELVSIMTFARPRFNNNYDYEVVRLCHKANTNIVGGTEKMFKEFRKRFPNTSIISYCDISKFTGNIYTKLGFEVSKISEPNYVWIDTDRNVILHRYQTQKRKLLKMFPEFDSSMTENEIMDSLGYIKVCDCGNLVCTYGNIN